MYNLYQYSQNKILQRQQTKQQHVMQTFLHKHENLKKEAVVRRKARLDDFIENQVSMGSPMVIPDQYMQRSVSQHQDIINQKSRIQKTKLSKLNLSSYNHRITTSNNSNIKKKSSIDQLHLTKEDSKFLEPIASYSHNFKQKASYSGMKFNQKANQLLKQYQTSRQKFNKVLYLNRDRYRLCRPQQFRQEEQSEERQLKGYSQTTNAKFAQNPEKTSLSIYLSETGEARSKSKTYFKLAKTEQLFATDNLKKMQLNSLLSRSHYNRIKNEAYSKQVTQLTGWSSLRSAELSSSVMIA